MSLGPLFRYQKYFELKLVFSRKQGLRYIVAVLQKISLVQVFERWWATVLLSASTDGREPSLEICYVKLKFIKLVVQIKVWFKPQIYWKLKIFSTKNDFMSILRNRSFFSKSIWMGQPRDHVPLFITTLHSRPVTSLFDILVQVITFLPRLHVFRSCLDCLHLSFLTLLVATSRGLPTLFCFAHRHFPLISFTACPRSLPFFRCVLPTSTSPACLHRRNFPVNVLQFGTSLQTPTLLSIVLLLVLVSLSCW